MGRAASAVQLLCTVGVMTGTPAVLHAQELVVNGGFESGNFFPWWVPPSIPNDSRFYVSPAAEFAHSGSHYAYLSSTSLQYIGQVLPTAAGVDYELSFWVRRVSLAPDQFKVRWEGQLVFNEFTINLDWDVWQHRTIPLEANITGSFLEFGQDHFPGAFFLDDVSVTQIVPAPSAATLLGVAGLVGLRRRRARH